MKRECSIANALDVVGERWALLVLREVTYGNRRFSGIADRTGAPTDVLTTRLKKLVAAGVLTTREYSSKPPRSEYVLTESGLELAPTLLLLLAWGDRWVSREPPARLAHRPTGEAAGPHEFVPMVVCRECGEPVGHGHLTMDDGTGVTPVPG